MRSYRLPKILKKGYLRVSDGHRVYFELCGNPYGQPAVFINGGPGGQFKDSHKRLFSSKYKVLFFDQRGAGRSKPTGKLKGNNTRLLIDDIARLFDKAGFESAIVAGTSWGTTLALCFAIKHPELVSRLFLTGVYLGTRKETDLLINHTLRNFAPEAWEEVRRRVPGSKRPHHTIFKKVATAPKSQALEWAKLMFTLEGSLENLGADYKKAKREAESIVWSEELRIYAHYMLNDCFLPPNYIMNNLQKIKHIPSTIVQGKQDLICPPRYAHEAAKKLNAKLTMVTGGHPISDKRPAILKALNRL